MRYGWSLNLIKSLLFWLAFALAFSNVALHPSVIAAFVTDDILRDVVTDRALLDQDHTTPAQRDEGIGLIRSAIVYASWHSAIVAAFMSAVWLVIAAVNDARLIYRPGDARKKWWRQFSWLLVATVVLIFSVQGNNFIFIGMWEETPLSGRIQPGFAQKLTFVTTGLGFVEFYLAVLFLTPPTLQPAVPFALWIGRLTDWIWGIGVSRRGNL